MSRTAVVLFTRDLRVHDHDGLAAATETHEQVVPLFVLDPAILRRFERGAVHEPWKARAPGYPAPIVDRTAAHASFRAARRAAAGGARP